MEKVLSSFGVSIMQQEKCGLWNQRFAFTSLFEPYHMKSYNVFNKNLRFKHTYTLY